MPPVFPMLLWTISVLLVAFLCHMRRPGWSIGVFVTVMAGIVLLPDQAFASVLAGSVQPGMSRGTEAAALCALAALIVFGIAAVPTPPGSGDTGSGSTAPTVTPFYLQPAFLLGITAPLAAMLAMKFGVTIDPMQLAVVIGGIGLLVLGMFHHSATVTAAQIDAHAQRSAAETAAKASASADAAAAALVASQQKV